jgi:hypothetical protein
LRLPMQRPERANPGIAHTIHFADAKDVIQEPEVLSYHKKMRAIS